MGASDSDVRKCVIVERSQLRAVAGASAPLAQGRDGMTSCIAQDVGRVMPPCPVSGLVQMNSYHVKSPNLGGQHRKRPAGARLLKSGNLPISQQTRVFKRRIRNPHLK
jgi:hypothetical protein